MTFSHQIRPLLTPHCVKINIPSQWAYHRLNLISLAFWFGQKRKNFCLLKWSDQRLQRGCPEYKATLAEEWMFQADCITQVILTMLKVLDCFPGEIHPKLDFTFSNYGFFFVENVIWLWKDLKKFWWKRLYWQCFHINVPVLHGNWLFYEISFVMFKVSKNEKSGWYFAVCIFSSIWIDAILNYGSNITAA